MAAIAKLMAMKLHLPMLKKSVFSFSSDFFSLKKNEIAAMSDATKTTIMANLPMLPGIKCSPSKMVLSIRCKDEEKMGE